MRIAIQIRPSAKSKCESVNKMLQKQKCDVKNADASMRKRAKVLYRKMPIRTYLSCVRLHFLHRATVQRHLKRTFTFFSRVGAKSLHALAFDFLFARCIKLRMFVLRFAVCSSSPCVIASSKTFGAHVS